MTQYSERDDFSSRPLFKLDVYVTATAISGGTQLYVIAEAVRTGSEIRTPFSNPGGSGSRSYNVPGGRIGSLGGSLGESNTLDWVFDFRPAGGTTSSNPYDVVVWGGFNRFIPSSYGSSTTVTISASMDLLGSASVSIPVTLFSVDPPVISGDFPDATLNVFYSESIFASNSPSSWNVSSGSIPPGLGASFSGSNFFLTGTPSSTGTYNFQVQATNSGGSGYKNFSITVSQPKPEISGNFDNGTVNQSYSDSVFASNSPTSWSRSGSLPPGLSGFGSGSNYFVSGTPTASGSYTFTLTASNAGGFDSESRTIFIAAPPNPQWSDLTYNTGKVGSSYSDTISATNATSVSGSGAPPGLSFAAINSSTLRLSGTPTSAGTFNMTVTANGQSGTTADVETATITINPLTPPAWTDDVIVNEFIVGTAYSDDVSATNNAQYQISSGQLPSGISINQSNGNITGTPTTKQNYSFTIRAYNNDGQVFVTYSGTTSAPPVFVDTTLADFEQGRPYSDAVEATSLTDPGTTYAVTSGALPPGISLNSNTGAVTGTPTGSDTHTFTITASNPDGTDTASFTKTVLAVPNWVENELTAFIENVQYLDSVEATNSPTYTISSGALPTGISIDSGTGIVSGTPSVLDESFSFTITASNADGSISESYSGTVQPDLGGGVKVYDGNAWVNREVYVYDGNAWVESKVHVYNGISWVKSLF